MVSKMKGYYACNYSLPLGCVTICNVLELAGLTSHGPRPDMWTLEAFWQNNAEHRCSCLCAITFSSQMCIYISDQYWEFPQSGNQLRCHKNLKSIFHSHSKLSVLDAVGGISVCCKTCLQVPDSRVQAWSQQSCLRRDKISYFGKYSKT